MFFWIKESLHSYFTEIELLLIIVGYGLSLFSIFFGVTKKEKLSIIFLTLSGISWYLLAAELDPFYNLWDERFHALVSQNLIQNPFKPLLFFEDYDPNHLTLDWNGCTIWLHKQPFFLWLSAISMAIGGNIPWVFRLPHALLSVAVIPMIWRTGKLLDLSSAGYYAAWFVTYSGWLFGLVSGRNLVDQNDVCFFVMVSSSVWAWLEYIHSNKKRWIILTGIFVGIAMLTKWLPGAWIFGVWAIYLLLGNLWKNNSAWKDFLLALLVCMLIFLPWQIYAYLNFPLEYAYEMEYNQLHLFNALEGHQEPWDFYLSHNLTSLYGWLGHLLLIPGFITWYYLSKSKRVTIALFGGVLGVYIFYSIAATKMPSYPFMCSLVCWLALGSTGKYIENWIISKKFKVIIISFGILVIAVMGRNIEEIQKTYTLQDSTNIYNSILRYNKNIFDKCGYVLPPGAVLFGTNRHQYIDAMIYSKHITYNGWPSEALLKILRKKGLKVGMLIMDGPKPEYMKNNPEIIWLPWKADTAW